jgi:hypothetical protein
MRGKRTPQRRVETQWNRANAVPEHDDRTSSERIAGIEHDRGVFARRY